MVQNLITKSYLQCTFIFTKDAIEAVQKMIVILKRRDFIVLVRMFVDLLIFGFQFL